MSGELDVLVVEDEPVVLDAARRLLAPEGLVVDRAASVQAATRKLREGGYRLILTDLMLPAVSGFELIERIGATSPGTPIVAISGYVTRQNVLESFRLGAFDFLPKPFDVGELLGVVRRALRFSAAGRPGPPAAAAGGRLHCLGGHSWARLETDGSATVGAGETFAGLVDDRSAIELPEAGEPAVQARCLVRLPAPDEVVYRVWAPLSGKVLASNERLLAAPELLDRQPFGGGWLVRLLPDDLDRELPALAPRPPLPAAAGPAAPDRR